jgi:hypothetical protein
MVGGGGRIIITSAEVTKSCCMHIFFYTTMITYICAYRRKGNKCISVGLSKNDSVDLSFGRSWSLGREVTTGQKSTESTVSDTFFFIPLLFFNTQVYIPHIIFLFHSRQVIIFWTKEVLMK